MAKLGVMAAARAANVHRATITRYCRRGLLSCESDANGKRLIDTAELGRVFGLHGDGHTRARLGADEELARLRTELDDERRERRELQERLWELTQRYTALLDDRRPIVTPAPPAPPGVTGGLSGAVLSTAETVRSGLQGWFERQAAKGRQ